MCYVEGIVQEELHPIDVAIGWIVTTGNNRVTSALLPESAAKNRIRDVQNSASRHYHDSLTVAEVQFFSELNSLVPGKPRKKNDENFGKKSPSAPSRNRFCRYNTPA
jgi:hypothetical protein